MSELTRFKNWFLTATARFNIINHLTQKPETLHVPEAVDSSRRRFRLQNMFSQYSFHKYKAALLFLFSIKQSKISSLLMFRQKMRWHRRQCISFHHARTSTFGCTRWMIPPRPGRHEHQGQDSRVQVLAFPLSLSL